MVRHNYNYLREFMAKLQASVRACESRIMEEITYLDLQNLPSSPNGINRLQKPEPFFRN
jgi:hypothetical protein